MAQAVKPRVRRALRPEGAAAPVTTESRPSDTASDHAEEGAPKKRRRRRRKPGESGDAGGQSTDPNS
jgi:poly(A) polymerase